MAATLRAIAEPGGAAAISASTARVDGRVDVEAPGRGLERLVRRVPFGDLAEQLADRGAGRRARVHRGQRALGE